MKCSLSKGVFAEQNWAGLRSRAVAETPVDQALDAPDKLCWKNSCCPRVRSSECYLWANNQAVHSRC